MCGIVGYCGKKSAETVLLVGLKKLEYRGYDSAGIAVLDQGDLVVHKIRGKIDGLEALLKGQNLRGNVGIGHTRWATHGEPSKLNSHPHTNRQGSIAVVHNGIIENYLELKRELQSEGYIFASFTDTEVIPHLVDKYLQEGFDLQTAFFHAIKRLEGKYAIGLVCDKEPEKVYFARNGNPLLIGRDKEKQEWLLASDIPALVPIAKEYMYLSDEQWGVFSVEGIELY
ncbi:MAG: glutamine--fructose-6-phosphate transaminase (isomerizing), partial [Candidatus Hydrogenedentota bacterium]